MSTGKKRLLAYVIMVISVLLSVKLVKDIIKLWHVDDRLIEAEEELLLAKREQEELKRQLKKVEGDEWWESQVRDTLKMARKDERIVVVPEEMLSFEAAEEKRVVKVIEDGTTNAEKWWQVFVY